MAYSNVSNDQRLRNTKTLLSVMQSSKLTIANPLPPSGKQSLQTPTVINGRVERLVAERRAAAALGGAQRAAGEVQGALRVQS